MSNQTTPAVVSDEGSPNTTPRPHSKRFVKVGFIVLLVGIIAAAVGWRLYDLRVNKTISINGTTVTSQEIKTYAAEVNRYATSHHENFGGTPTQVAENDLVLNAALKDQAKKHNITLTQADIDTALQSKYKAYGSKQAYQAALKGLGIANIMKVRDENTAYESILQNVLIANKQLFITGIYYNAPYFSNSTKQTALRAQATKIVQTKLLPLFQQHLSRAAIGKQTTVDTLNPNTSQADQSKLFFTGMPTTDMYVANYSAATPYFNESGTNNIPGAKSANDAANSLTKVGQYTPVETFKSGIIGIMRLEGQTKGAYNSWTQLQQQYEAKYAKGFAFSQSTHQNFAQLFGKLIKPFGVLWQKIDLQVFPATYAAGSCSAAGGPSSHYATFYIRSFDMTTGAQLPPIGVASQIGGAFVEETRSDASTGGGLACANVNGTVIDDDHPNTGYTFSNNLIFQDNCWNAAPTWSQTAPSGWTWQPQDDVSRNIQIGSDGWPVWNNGNINSVGNIDFSLAYLPPQPPPTPTPPTTVDGGVALICTNLQYSASTIVVNKVSKQLQGFITLTGANVNGGGTSNWPNDTKNHVPDNTYINGIAGGIPVTSIDVGVTPTAQTVTVSIAEYYEGNGSLVYYDTVGGTTTPQCYQATCSIQSVVGNLPDGQIGNGGTATVTATITNNSYDTTATSDVANQLAIPATDPTGAASASASDVSPNDLIIQSNLGNSGPLGGVPTYGSTPGYSIPVTFTITAPATGTTGSISAAVSYDGDYFVSPACPGSFPIYQPPLVNIDSAICGSSTPTLNGWAFAQNGEQGQEIDVSVFVDGPPGTGTPMGPGDSGTPGVYGTDVYRSDVDLVYSITGTHGFSIPIPTSYQDGQDHTFYVVADDPNGVENSGPAQITMTGCGSFHLAPTVNGGTLEDASGKPTTEHPTQFCGSSSVAVTYGNGWGGPASGVPANASYWFTGPGGGYIAGYPATYPYSNFLTNPAFSPCIQLTISLVSGQNYCIDMNVNPTDGYIDRTGKVLTSSGSATPTASCDTVHNEPFVHFLDGDVSAGGGFNGSGNCANPGGIYTYTNGFTNNDIQGIKTTGSSVQIGALSLGPIAGFSSASLHDGSTSGSSPPISPTGLTFSNQVNTTGVDGSDDAPNEGGNLGGVHCATDYWGSMPTSGVTSSSASSMSLNYASAGDTTINSTPAGGTLTINGGSLGDGAEVAVYVTGNVYITDDITYANTTWSSLADIPSLYIIDRGGTVYMDPGVQQLDGIYVSQPDSSGTGGYIDTCDTTATRLPGSSLLTSCKNQLEVNGAFVAKQVYLDRSFGSLRDEAMIPGAAAGSGTPGADTALIWNTDGGVNDNGQGGDGSTTGKDCTQINEPWDSAPDTTHTWDDNYLCVPTTSSIKLAWSYQGLPATATTTTPDCTVSWGSVVDPYGVPSGTGLLGLLGPNRGWSDNYLCSNYPISFQVGNPDPTGATQYCTLVNEPADSEGSDPPGTTQNVWQDTYVCITKPVAGSPAGPSTPPTPPLTDCSNAGLQILTNTCAAEVFNFSPESYLSQPAIERISGPTTGKFDYITSLSPVL